MVEEIMTEITVVNEVAQPFRSGADPIVMPLMQKRGWTPAVALKNLK